MSDLISRSDVIQILKECNLDDTLFEKDVFDKIRNLPTAYDVDKVVATMDEALIELEDGTNCGTCVLKKVCDDGYDGCIQTIVAVCKSIVKAGGNIELPEHSKSQGN
jgi:hypothetical protein